MLDLGAVLNGDVLVGGQMGLAGRGVAVLDEQGLDVAVQGEATSAFGVIPCQVDASKF